MEKVITWYKKIGTPSTSKTSDLIIYSEGDESSIKSPIDKDAKLDQLEKFFDGMINENNLSATSDPITQTNVPEITLTSDVTNTNLNSLDIPVTQISPLDLNSLNIPQPQISPISPVNISDTLISPILSTNVSLPNISISTPISPENLNNSGTLATNIPSPESLVNTPILSESLVNSPILPTHIPLPESIVNSPVLPTDYALIGENFLPLLFDETFYTNLLNNYNLVTDVGLVDYVLVMEDSPAFDLVLNVGNNGPDYLSILSHLVV